MLKFALNILLVTCLLVSSQPSRALPQDRQISVPSVDAALEGEARIFSVESFNLFSKIFNVRPNAKEDMLQLRQFFKNQGVRLPKSIRAEVLDSIHNFNSLERPKTIRSGNFSVEFDIQFNSLIVRKNLKASPITLPVENILRNTMNAPTAEQIKNFRLFLNTVDSTELKHLAKMKDKLTLVRILRGFNKNRMELGRIDSKLAMEKLMTKFVSYLETHYSLTLSKADRRALDRFDKILNADRVSKKEINLFRLALKDMGIPSSILGDELIRIYLLDALHVDRAQEKVRLGANLGDKPALELLKDAKNHFDFQHLQGIKQRNKFINTLKSFPAQFILFQAAIGASIYREHFTDPLIYESYKNPEPFEAIKQSLTPTGVFSFYVFVVTMQATEYGLYKKGIDWDNRFLKSIAPTAGLGAGFFTSLVLDEIIHDMELRQCVHSIMNEEAGEQAKFAHIPPCEHSYLKWIKNGKWTRYAADVVGILAASFITHKILHNAVFLARMTSLGSKLLTQMAQKLGRLTGWVGFFVTLWAFMEVHKVIDEYMIQPTKKYFLVENIITKVHGFYSMLNSIKEKFSGDQLLDSETREEVQDKIKVISVLFSEWPKAKGAKYEQAFFFWKTRTDRTTTSYDAAKELLDYLYARSQRPRDLFISMEKEVNQLEKQVERDLIKAVNDREKQSVVEGFEKQLVGMIEKYNSLARESIEFLHFDSEGFDKNVDYYESEVCSLIEENEDLKTKLVNQENDFQEYGWVAFCENPEETSVDLKFLSYQTGLVLDVLLGKQLELMEHRFSKDSLDRASRISLDSYLSSDPSTFFQDINVEFFKESHRDPVNIYKKLYVARKLIQSLSSNELHYSEEAHENMQKVVCYLSKEESCSSDSVKELTRITLKDKSLASGIYLAKNIISKLGSVEVAYPYFEPIERVSEFINVYRKGEKFFVEDPNLQAFDGSFLEKNPITFYHFMTDFICGEQAGEIESNGRFSAPQLFPELSHVCDKLEGFTLTDTMKQKILRENYFHVPVISQGKSYQSIYIALEASIRNNFSTKQDLIDLFKSKSKSTVDYASDSIVDGLGNIVHNFVKPGILNLDNSILDITNCQDIQDYYTIDRAQDFKGLEIILAQVVFWLNKLKDIKHLEKMQEFDVNAYEKRSCQVVEMLKGYHDTYALNKKLPTMKKVREEELLSQAQNGKDILTNLERKSKGGQVFLPAKVILALILQKTYPDWNAPIIFNSMINNYSFDFENEGPGYSMVSEMYKSLLLFYQYLQFIGIKDNVQDAIAG